MNAVPLDQLDRTVAEAIRQVQNGRYMAAIAGVQTDLKKPVAFQLNVALAGGINAISRADATEQAGDQVTVTEDGQQVTNEESSGRSDTSTETGTSTSTETDTTTETGTQNNSQGFGRQTTTDITYEA